MAPSLQPLPPFWTQALRRQPSATGLTQQEGNGSWTSLNLWSYLLFGKFFNTFFSWELGTEHKAMPLDSPLAFDPICALDGLG